MIDFLTSVAGIILEAIIASVVTVVIAWLRHRQKKKRGGGASKEERVAERERERGHSHPRAEEGLDEHAEEIEKRVAEEVRKAIGYPPLTFPEASRIWRFGIFRYEDYHDGKNFFVIMEGPFLTDNNEEVYRAKTTGTRYRLMYEAEEDALKRVVEYAMENLLDLTSDNASRGLLSLGVGHTAATDKEGGVQARQKKWDIYKIKTVPIANTNKIALSADLRVSGDEVFTEYNRSESFSRAQIKPEIIKFASFIYLDMVERTRSLPWEG